MGSDSAGRESGGIMRGRAELIVGVTAGILGIFSALAATFVPLYPVQNTQRMASLVQEDGAPTALLVCSTFVILSLWVLLCAVAHVRWPDAESLYLLWIGTIVLIFLSTVGGVILSLVTSLPFAYVGTFLMPEAVLALVCAILASVHQALISRG
jgi:hypothetical protein